MSPSLSARRGPGWGLLVGHVLDGLAKLPDASVQVCVTSPPYFGLRAYGTCPQVWGGRPDCAHDWEPQLRKGTTGGTASPKVRIKGTENFQIVEDSTSWTCDDCGAWKGELGSEPTPASFVAHLAEVFREVRRVLRPDGLLFLNIADSYAGSGKGPTGHNGIQKAEQRQSFVNQRSTGVPKSMQLVPERLLLALADDGWIVRSKIVWAKPNPMPELIRDRPTKSYEHVFMLARSGSYYWDHVSAKEPAVSAGKIVKMPDGWATGPGGHGTIHPTGREKGRPKNAVQSETRNIRDVWTITTKPYKEAHFATFPPALPERCIRLGSRPGDLVLDPFAGSGTALKVALDLGRKAIGCELKPDYAELAVRRLAEAGYGAQAVSGRTA